MTMLEKQRNLALDVFRGMTICFMIIVNSPGSWDVAYAPLLHASWHGFTPTDLVFPSFLFAVGNAMAFVMYKYEELGSAMFWRKTLKRTIIIFLVGYLLYWFPFVQESGSGDLELKPLESTRILGVLQRIALCYLVASIVIHYCSTKVTLWFSTLALLGYWSIMLAYGDPNDPYSLIGNAALKVDLAVLGDKHLYHGEGIAFDPEGILSTIPAIVNVIIGYLAGNFIRKRGSNFETIAKLMICAALLTLTALAWHTVFPINKKLWTSSFVLLTTGLDLMMISLLIYSVDILKNKKWTSFFTVFGKNPLFIYLLSEILLISLYLIPVGDSNVQKWIAHDIFESFLSPINASLLFALTFMLANWIVGYILDKKKIYIKV
jgi:predicted acyltransferase